MINATRGGLTWAVLASFAPLANSADPPLLARIVGDHVVLQRDRPIDIYGAAGPRDEVTATLSGAALRATADGQGRWRIAMPELPAGGPHTLAARTKDRLQNADDVLVGDVWLCSGQSNMEWTVRNTLNADN